jgi:hypothetical protein
MKKTTGPGKPKPMMKDMKKSTMKDMKPAMKSAGVGGPAGVSKKLGSKAYDKLASKKTENIKPMGIAKAAKMDKPLPKKLNTGKMVEKSIAASKERKAAKKRNRRENLQMLAGGLGATAGTILVDIKHKTKKRSL